MNKLTILIDLDQIAVNMVSRWLERYSEITGEQVPKEKDICDYEMRNFMKSPQLLDEILLEKDFFLNLLPIKDSPKYIAKLIEDGHDVVILTQPPRNSDWAVAEKRRWMLKYVPGFNLANMIFAHRKDLVKGSILFDDAPRNLTNWKRANPEGITAKITYPYNKHIETDLSFKKASAWRMFYESIKKMST